MHKRCLTGILTSILIFFSSSSYAIPTQDIGLSVWPPFWQFEKPWGEKPYGHPELNEKIKDKGCALTSLAMLMKYNGFRWMLDENHESNTDLKLDPGTLNDWLLDNWGYHYFTNAVNWLSIKRFYWHPLYAPFYKYLRPDFSCWNNLGQNNCFPLKWSAETENILDFDLEWGQVDIAKIIYDPAAPDGRKPKENWRTHFVTLIIILIYLILHILLPIVTMIRGGKRGREKGDATLLNLLT